ncbi:hypothetical protein ABZV61_29105 [Streptomyces sp900116325]|uniref:IstB-like ATP-binding protein domain-containing protein n=1 Tax=Streptomyces sp. 900116325 TaxID=3154295 RepID=A0ABV2UFY2_9ACTN
MPAPDGWTKNFTDPGLCAGIIDRLSFNGAVIQTGTKSYRPAHTKTLTDRTSVGRNWASARAHVR